MLKPMLQNPDRRVVPLGRILLMVYNSSTKPLETIILDRLGSRDCEYAAEEQVQKRSNMLTRQKILLLMLEIADRPVQRLELMAWSFLLRHETETKGESAFYDFVPYRGGPFSFALDQEIEKLLSKNDLLSDEDQVCKVTTGLMPSEIGLSSAVERDVSEIVREYGQLSSQDLLNSVHRRYPAFTVNSERQRLAPRPKAEVAVYTAGYEGLSIDGFLNLLITSGIERLIDVRNNPTARRYGFHKSTLSRLLNQLEMEYRHFAELGIPSEIRQLFPADGDRGLMFDEYEISTLRRESAAVRDVAKLVSERPSVLVCMEAEPACCHRSRLANPVAKLTDLPIVHLRPGTVT